MKTVILLALLLLVGQATPAVTLRVDRGWYGPGESVVVDIATIGDANNTAYLWLYIDGPDGRNLYFTPLPFRSQTLTWMIPGDAVEGTYKVTVTWDHRYVETGFIIRSQPIPEFPFTPALVLVLALATATFALSWRKASARAKTPASHS